MARMSRQESKELTRQRLRTAALEEFERYGVAGGSIDRITDAAGYSRGAFYANYASKFELALELWSENAAQQTADIEAMMVPVAAQPCLMLDRIRDNFNELTAQKVWWTMAVELRLEAMRNPEFQVQQQVGEHLVKQRLHRMLTGLCRAAGCEQNVDIDYITMVVLSFTHGISINGALTSTPTPGDALARLLHDLLGHPPALLATSGAS